MKDRIVYVNGNYLNETEAKVSIFDRGFLFADAVYEVTAVIDGKIIEWYENGQEYREQNFSNGKKDGLIFSWYESGSKKEQEYFLV